MIKIGLKIQLKRGSNYLDRNCTLDEDCIYEIATQRQQDKKFVIFDKFNEPRYLTEDEILKDFIIVEEIKSLVNKLKNPKASHYNLWLDTDSIDIIKANLTEEEYIGALKFNILKYQLRLGKKDCIESDMEKIEDYKRELNDILGKR